MSLPTKRVRLFDGLLREELFQNEIIDLVKLCWKNSQENSLQIRGAGVEIIHDPFPVCIVHDLIQDINLLKTATEDIKNIKFNEKNNDLYQFKQSDDVRNVKNESVQRLYGCIRTEVRHFISKVLENVDLKDDISATFSMYSYHDRLLCHDDKCGDRHIAFILYLVEDWKETDGGCLQLFSADSKGYPDKVIKSLCPKFNALAFFEVTHTSFHQVSEVLTADKIRLSLNGWFHLNGKKMSSLNECQILNLEECLATDSLHKMSDYFSDNYFNQDNILSIKKLFLVSSEIQLEKFLLPKYWDQLQQDIKNSHIKWVLKGPPNIRKYEIADSTTLPSSLKTLKSIFESKQWFEFLKSMTSLDFVPSANSDLTIWECGRLPACYCEIQKWSHTNYTMVHDKNPEFRTEALDIILRIPSEEIETSEDPISEDNVPEAGHIIYIDRESKDEECLLHVGYKSNSLALVYRDSKTLRFTKYLHSGAPSFYQVFCTFYPWRPPVDQPDLKHCEDSTTDYSSNDESTEEVDSEE